MKTPTHDLCGSQTPPRFGQLRRRNEKTDKRPRLLQRRGLFLFAPPHGGAARFNLRLLQRRGTFIFAPPHGGAARFIFCRSRLLAAAAFRFTIRHAASFFKLFYACLLRRTIKVQAPLTSYSPTAEIWKQSPAAKGSSPRFHLKCPPPARTRSTSSPSVNSL